MNIQTLSNLLKRLHIRIPEWFWKEELVRFLAEDQTERIVEVPLVLSRIPKNKQTILDVGCRYSLLAIQLASIGHEVYGIDVNRYHRIHPNFHFFQGDIAENKYKSNFFDIVISLSSIEHFGLGAYGDKLNINGDKDAAGKIHRILKKRGKFLLTIPFGLSKDSSWYRVYDRKRLIKLLKDFRILHIKIFQRKNEKWFSCAPRTAEKLDGSKEIYDAIAFVEAIKR